jgi:hypothetical protein
LPAGVEVAHKFLELDGLGAVPRLAANLTMNKSDFEETTLLIGDTYRYPGLVPNPPEHWNGWEVPYFDAATAAKMAVEMANDKDYPLGTTFDGEVFSVADADYPGEPPLEFSHVMIGDTKYWPIGAWYWTWWREDA